MMVCRYDESRLVLVLQIDHSRIAGLLAAHWGNSDFARPKPYASMVLAAQEHDNGWWDWEIKPTVDEQGYPIDYINSILRLPPGVWLRFFRHGIEKVAALDPYAAYNVSTHSEGLLNQGRGLLPYMPDYTGRTDVQEYIRQQNAYRAMLLEELRQSEDYKGCCSEEHLWLNFKYMEVFDQFAQFVCNRFPFNSTWRKNGPTNKLSNTPVPVGPGQSDTTITVEVQDEQNAIVKPYPFDVNPLLVSFPARFVQDRPYVDQDDFLNQYYKAERLTVSYYLHARCDR